MKKYVSIRHTTHVENLHFTCPLEARDYYDLARTTHPHVALRTRPMSHRATRKLAA